MATNTTNNYFSKPAVGGDTDTWGTTLNTNWDAVDSIVTGGTSITRLGIGTTNSTLPLICNAASATSIAASFSGLVGIGTDNPQAKLEVNGGTGVASTGGTLVVRQDGDTDSDGIALTSSNATSHRIWKDSSGKLNIGPSNLPSALVQDTSGSVGIGTDSPAGNLHISAGTDGDATLILEADTDNLGSENDNPRLEFRQDNNLVQGSMYLEGDNDTTASGAVVNSLLLDVKNEDGNNYLQFATGGTAGSSPTNSTVRMTVTSGGNVGIGNNSPSALLHVGTLTKSSTTKLKIENAAGYAPTLEFNQSGTGAASIAVPVDTNALQFNRFNGSTLSESMRIDASGNVGINTDSPTEKLHVVGSSMFAGGATFDGGTSTTVNVLCDNAGNASLNLMGADQGTGRLYVGQSSTHGGGIEYNGDSDPVTSGGGTDQIVLYRRSSSTNEWTARNSHNSNDWEFRGKVTADELVGTLAASIFNQIYPMGCIYESTDSTSPATLFGGTWSSYGSGRVLVGSGTLNDGTESQTFTAGATSGKFNHTLSQAQMPSHRHILGIPRDVNGSANNFALMASSNADEAVKYEHYSKYAGGAGSTANGTLSSAGATQSHNNLQPYVVVYRWRRTALA